MVLAAFQQVRTRLPQARLILAPRHPERFAEAEGLIQCGRLHLREAHGAGRAALERGRSAAARHHGRAGVVYPVAEVVFVGGSLVPSGGHNVLEPAAAGKAVVVGPHMENFQEIADQFRADGALVEVVSPGDLADALLGLLTDDARRREVGERARALVLRSRGAVRRTVEALAELLG